MAEMETDLVVHQLLVVILQGQRHVPALVVLHEPFKRLRAKQTCEPCMQEVSSCWISPTNRPLPQPGEAIDEELPCVRERLDGV